MLAELADEFETWPVPEGGDRLHWPGHADQLARDSARTGQEDAVLIGRGRVGGRRVILIAFEFGFRGGTLGERAAGAIVHAIARARAERIPLVSLIASGGVRVQEGMTSLVGLQRIAAQLASARRAGVPHLAVLRDPTSGGVWASLGASADVILVLRHAEVAFAGARLRATAPSDTAFRAEGQYGAGAVDAVIDDGEMADRVGAWVAMLDDAVRSPGDRLAPPAGISKGPSSGRPWDSVLAARSARRPRAGAYLDSMFAERLEIRGDRVGGRDDGVACGLARRSDGRIVAFAAQHGTATTAAGFRTITRLLDLAQRLRVPVLTLIDTPGAAADAQAEVNGIGPAIAETLIRVADARVPITSVVIGEGGSGGALALADPHHLWAAPDSYFSVTTPESVGEIVWRDRSLAPVVSEHLGLRPADLVRLGIARGVLSAPRRPRSVPA